MMMKTFITRRGEGVSVRKGRLLEGSVWIAERNRLTMGARRMGEAKARKLILRSLTAAVI